MSAPRLIISCPACGRTGNLPERFRVGEQSLRCKRCKTRFRNSTELLERQGGAPGRDHVWGVWSSVSADREHDSELMELGSADSHYELPSVVADGPESPGTDQDVNPVTARAEAWAAPMARPLRAPGQQPVASIEAAFCGGIALGIVGSLVLSLVGAIGFWFQIVLAVAALGIPGSRLLFARLPKRSEQPGGELVPARLAGN